MPRRGMRRNGPRISMLRRGMRWNRPRRSLFRRRMPLLLPRMSPPARRMSWNPRRPGSRFSMWDQMLAEEVVSPHRFRAGIRGFHRRRGDGCRGLNDGSRWRGQGCRRLRGRCRCRRAGCPFPGAGCRRYHRGCRCLCAGSRSRRTECRSADTVRPRSHDCAFFECDDRARFRHRHTLRILDSHVRERYSTAAVSTICLVPRLLRACLHLRAARVMSPVKFACDHRCDFARDIR